MRAILVAAGVGSRLNGYIDKPKSTLDIGGVPLIVRTVDMLLSNGVDVAIAVGYRKEDIIEQMGDRKVTYYYNPFFRKTNSIASFWFCKDFIDDDDLIVANADVFWEEESLKALIKSNKMITMLGDKSTAKNGDFVLKLNNDMIIGYGKDLKECDRDSESVGVALIKKEFIPQFLNNLNELIDSEHSDMWWDNILYNYSNEYPVHVIDISDHFWAEIDYIDDYERIMKYIRTNDVSAKYKKY